MRTALRTSLIGASAAAIALTGFALPRSAGAQALNDPTIVAIFDAANTWDIETGGLAAKRAKSKEVREFGQMLVRDHKAVRQQGRDLAKKLHVTPTPPKNFGMAKDHAEAMAKLSKLHGAAFDKAFLAHEVAFHKAVLDAVTTTLLPALQNAEVKDMVTKVGPAFQAHMIKAQSLLDSYPTK
jgi:putative membrane protein